MIPRHRKRKTMFEILKDLLYAGEIHKCVSKSADLDLQYLNVTEKSMALAVLKRSIFLALKWYHSMITL